MQITKSKNKPHNVIKTMLWIATGIFVIAILTIFFQNFETIPNQTEIRKEIKVK